MKSVFLKLIVFVGILSLASCMGKQNQAPNEGMYQDSEYIYGVRGGEPRQLPNQYPADEDGTVAERIANIREKLYPKTQTEETPIVVEAETTATDTTSSGN